MIYSEIFNKPSKQVTLSIWEKGPFPNQDGTTFEIMLSVLFLWRENMKSDTIFSFYLLRNLILFPTDCLGTLTVPLDFSKEFKINHVHPLLHSGKSDATINLTIAYHLVE